MQRPWKNDLGHWWGTGNILPINTRIDRFAGGFRSSVWTKWAICSFSRQMEWTRASSDCPEIRNWGLQLQCASLGHVDFCAMGWCHFDTLNWLQLPEAHWKASQTKSSWRLVLWNPGAQVACLVSASMWYVSSVCVCIGCLFLLVSNIYKDIAYRSELWMKCFDTILPAWQSWSLRLLRQWLGYLATFGPWDSFL